jgi:hypothetical protein
MENEMKIENLEVDDVANRPPTIDQLIAHAEDFLRTLILQFEEDGTVLSRSKLTPEYLYEIWEGFFDVGISMADLGLMNSTVETIMRTTYPALLLAHWKRTFDPPKRSKSILRPAIISMFRTHAERSNWSFDEADIEDCQQKTWIAVWQALTTGGPALTERRGIEIASGIRVSDLQPCACKGNCKCPEGGMSLQRWLPMVAGSVADAHYRETHDRNQTEDKRLSRLRNEPNGSSAREQDPPRMVGVMGKNTKPARQGNDVTFHQYVMTKHGTRSLRAAAELALSGPPSRDQEFFEGDEHAAWEGESSPCPIANPHTMSLRPGALLCYGLVAGRSDDAAIGVDSGSLTNAKLKRYSTPGEITHGELVTSVVNAWRFNSATHHADAPRIVDDSARMSLADYYRDLSANYDAYCPRRDEESSSDYLARVKPAPQKPAGPVEYAIRRGHCPPAPVVQVTSEQWDAWFVADGTEGCPTAWKPRHPIVIGARDKSYRYDHPEKLAKRKVSKDRAVRESEENLASMGMQEPTEGIGAMDLLLNGEPADTASLEEYDVENKTVWVYERTLGRAKVIRTLTNGQQVWIDLGTIANPKPFLAESVDLRSVKWTKAVKAA